MKTAQDMAGKANAEAMATVETKLDGTVSRREYDARLVAVESRLVELGVRLREIDVIVLKLQATSPLRNP